ncbi:MAG: tyrosine-type recombinase/integrase [Sphingomonadales bacterium]|nr:tyrosine-type recombinase/integrase [Sphingomonadales bacterium]
MIDDLPRRPNNSAAVLERANAAAFEGNLAHLDQGSPEAGLDKLRIHDLRHTFASHAAMNKETLPMIGRLLGPANPPSTARYAHLDDEHLLGAAQQIGDAVERLMVAG